MGALLDAFALVALLRDEAGADDVEAIVARGAAAIPALNLAETIDTVMRADGIGEEELRGLLEPLGIAVLPLTEHIAWRAAALRSRHYRRRQSELSLADCALVATATQADVVVTGDRPVLRMATAEGVRTHELAAA